MNQYQRIVNGVVTNQWTDATGNASYTEPGWGDPSTYTVVTQDITAQVAQQALVSKGLAAQTLGAQIIAQIYAINETNLASGALTSAQFAAMLADATLANIERCLKNGSIATALALTNSDSALSTYFSSDQIAQIKALMVAP